MDQDVARLNEQLSAAERAHADLLDEIADLRIEIEDLQYENEDLQEREALARALIEEAPDALFVHDLEGRFVFVNDAACKLLNFSRKEFLSMSVRDVELGVSPEQLRAFWDEAESGKAVRTEGLLRRKDGSQIPADIRIGLFDATENVAIYGIARDISERKELEERIRHSQKMEAVGTLAGGIAHDFNNILGIILGCAELGGDPLPKDHPTHEYLKEIKTATVRAKEVVQQLLSFSQKSDETREPLRIEPLVKESLKLMRSTIPANIEIETTIDEDCYRVMANPAQIHQVIINMCTNAAYAARKGGAIYVSLKNQVFRPSGTASNERRFRGEYLRMTIRDTGCGMSPELTERIFDPYFTTRDVGKGSGMGLAVVHGIVQSLGGEIKVYSQIDHGSTFDIFFPAVARRRKGFLCESEDAAVLPGGSEHILVVDDETAIVSGLKERLKGLGYTVEGYTSPEEALAAAKQQPGRFDLMITDMAMPKMTGEILIRHVKNVHPDLPVILCTGFSEWVDERAPEKIRAVKVLLKPITREELARSIREVMDSSRRKLSSGTA